MAFRFDIEESSAANAERMLTRQVAKAARLLRTGLDDDAQVAPGIHGARKCLKRARAVLKLVRPGIKRSAAKRLNASLRLCAQSLGSERDRAVGLATLQWLAERPEGVSDQLAAAIRKLYLAPDETAARTRSPGDDVREVLLDAVAQADAIAAAHIPKLDLARLENRDVAQAYAATYADGRARFFALDILTADDEDVHDLRKPVQHHWRQTALLLALWPDALTLRLETARRVSKTLGIDHDLSILASRVEEGLHVRTLSAEKRLFLARCRELQRELRSEVAPWLRRLYGAPPAMWEEAITQWWTAARDELAQESRMASPLVPMRATSHV